MQLDHDLVPFRYTILDTRLNGKKISDISNELQENEAFDIEQGQGNMFLF